MTKTTAFQIPSRPVLEVRPAGGAGLGNCYSAHYFAITSLRPLDGVTIYALRDAGFLGYGQEFWFHQVDGEGKKIANVPERFLTAQEEYGPKTDLVIPGAVASKTILPSLVEKVAYTQVDDRTGKPTGQLATDYRGNPMSTFEQKVYIYRCESRVDSSD